MRDKNKNFIYKYGLNDKNIKDMLLSINKEDIKYELEDNEYLKYGNERLIVIIKNHYLVDFYGNGINLDVYIKIKKKEDNLAIISFHDSL